MKSKLILYNVLIIMYYFFNLSLILICCMFNHSITLQKNNSIVTNNNSKIVLFNDEWLEMFSVGFLGTMFLVNLAGIVLNLFSEKFLIRDYNLMRNYFVFVFECLEKIGFLIVIIGKFVVNIKFVTITNFVMCFSIIVSIILVQIQYTIYFILFLRNIKKKTIKLQRFVKRAYYFLKKNN